MLRKVSTPSGPAGPAGPQGEQGPAGTDGADGLDGADGDSWLEYYIYKTMVQWEFATRCYIDIPTAGTLSEIKVTTQIGVVGVVTCTLDPDGTPVVVTVPNPSDAGDSGSATPALVIASPTSLEFETSAESFLEIRLTITRNT